MIAIPDPATFQLVTWRQTAAPIARMFCDILEPNGTPFAGDSRHCLKRNLQAAASKGYSFYVGPELEFFLFESSTSPKPLDSGGYFDAPPLDLAGDIRREIISCLRSMGIPVEYGHHEVAPSQHELALRYTDALKMADTAITYRVVVKEIAARTAATRPSCPSRSTAKTAAACMCIQSLFKNGRNLFYDADGDHHLSREAKSYIAGLLTHCKEFTAITNQWVNSYKRLVPGFEAPTNIAWARRNRSTLVRVPMYKPGKEAATRVELRSPDPACNPYLTFACMLAAGLKGIEENYALSAPVEEDIYNMTQGTPGSRHREPAGQPGKSP
jgi:L-glutamine synthetase (EC 6.3.1.2)